MIVLETERLLFRDHEPRDLEPFCAIEMDAEVRRFVGGFPRTRREAGKRFGELLRSKSTLPFCAAVLKESGEYIGRCGLHPLPVWQPALRLAPRPDGPRAYAALGFYLARRYWGRGLATEAARAFVDYGFRQLKLPRIVATAEVGNDASIRVLEKAGFELVAVEEGDGRSFRHYAVTAWPSP